MTDDRKFREQDVQRLSYVDERLFLLHLKGRYASTSFLCFVTTGAST